LEAVDYREKRILSPLLSACGQGGGRINYMTIKTNLPAMVKMRMQQIESDNPLVVALTSIGRGKERS
jgi:hypothetical protein